jgi:cutinase
MGAYSQGGQVLHKAAALLPASTMAQVSSVVIFGDPGMISPQNLSSSL